MQAQNPFEKVPIVTITNKGIFKYILIQGQQKNNSNKKYLFVRGNQDFQYHSENYKAFQQQLKKHGFTIKKGNSESKFTCQKDGKQYKFICPGGGRIEHNYNNNKCFIYGYSQSFGKIDHKIAQQLVSKELKYDINEIITSQKGY